MTKRKQDLVIKRTWTITITTVPSSGQIEYCNYLNVLELLPYLELSEHGGYLGLLFIYKSNKFS